MTKGKDESTAGNKKQGRPNLALPHLARAASETDLKLVPGTYLHDKRAAHRMTKAWRL